MFLSDRPNPELWPTRLLDCGDLIVASIADVYGEQRLVHAHQQRDTFAAVLAEALGQGYSGIRVAADNTSLVSTPERLKAWTVWEGVAEQFMADNPVTGLCAFDRRRTQPAVLRSLIDLHPVLAPN